MAVRLHFVLKAHQLRNEGAERDDLAPIRLTLHGMADVHLLKRDEEVSLLFVTVVPISQEA